MKKLSKKMMIFIGSIILFIGVLSLYMVNTPKEMTRVEELQIEQAEKEKNESKPVLTKKSGDSKINIVEKEDPYLEKTLFPLINDVINYEYISYDTESSYDKKLGFINYYISADMVSVYGKNENMWAELANKLHDLLKKNEEENPNGTTYHLLVKELNKDDKTLISIGKNGKRGGTYAPKTGVNESEANEEIDEDAYLGKRVVFNKNLNDSLVLIKTNLDSSGVYTEEIAQALKDLALLIEDYYSKNTPTEKYTDSEGALRSSLKLLSEIADKLPIAMQDSDIEKMTELIEKMNNGLIMFEVSNLALDDEANKE